MLPFVSRQLRHLPPLRRVEHFKENPLEVQTRLLRRLLRSASDTEWGRRFGFTDLAAEQNLISAYRERVPLHEYDDIRADVERVRRGERDVLWRGTQRHFAVSSGTASAGKIIPVSRQMLNANKRFSVEVGVNYLAQSANAAFLFGKHLTLPGRIEESERFPGNLIGEVSGLQAENAPKFFSRLLQAVPNDISFLPNWEQKLRAVADHTMGQDIRLMVMAPTWGLVFFEALIKRYNERHGTSVSSVAEIWPNLQVLMSGGVALRSYKSLLADAIGNPDLHFIETYGASEGFFSFQDQIDDPSMLLHLDNGVYFEFVPMDRMHDENPPRLSIAEVQTGVRYAMFVSTCSGLWAYNVGDVVRFTSTDPHRILVAGRTSEMVDRFGEAVFGEEARAAVRIASEATGARVLDFHLAPRLPDRATLPSHEWLIEFETEPADIAAFARHIDEHLQQVNRHYQIRREAKAFGMPTVTPLPRGAFYRWLKEVKGKVSGQTKVPRMSEERAIADRVLALNGTSSRRESPPGSPS